MEIQILVGLFMFFLSFTYKWSFGSEEQEASCIDENGSCLILPYLVLTFFPFVMMILLMIMMGIFFFAIDLLVINTVLKPIHGTMQKPTEKMNIMSLAWMILVNADVWMYFMFTYIASSVMGVLILYGYNVWNKFSERKNKINHQVIKDVSHHAYMFCLLTFTAVVCFNVMIVYVYRV
jgi:hypothetical protein